MTRRFLVRGRVQGVGYRYFVETKAEQIGIVGEVWNNRDGTVELIASGEEAELDELFGALHHGPGHVASITFQEVPNSPNFQDFRISR